MSAADIIDGRFELVRLAGEGGMGRVYEATDRLTGGPVALKVIRDAAAQTSGRFLRETRMLAGLRHPGVVRYVAHGVTASGEPYLAMEWLTGETLSARLKRAGISVAESVVLALAIARALGAVHRAGVVHRDIKPSNVFLVERAPERPVLIDFGIARPPELERRITGSGVMIGTPGYMAPEQVRGELKVDARADVFSLGCVLFRCLTGRDAFPGGASLADSFKVLLEDPPNVSSLRPSVPAALDALVARMLARERAARPPDADTVVAALEGLELRALEARRSVAPPSPSSIPPPLELTTSERRLVCLLLVRDPDGGDGSDAARRALLAEVERYHGALGAVVPTSPSTRPDPPTQPVGGVLPVVISGAGAPTDLATRAARCAVAVRDALGGAPVALCAGLVEDVRRAAGGELLARAERLLEAASARGASSPVHVDEVSAGLLAARFDVRQEGATLALHHEIEEIDAGRRLHGRPSVCLGREREIALLEALFACSVEDEAANVALITGEAGVGKSRLRHELLRRLRARGQRFEAWVAHGDPMSTRSPFAVLARAVRHAAQITNDDPIEVRRNRIRRLAARVPEPARATVFLAELAGAPFEAGASVELTAAREDPLLMGDQIRSAAEDLIRAVASEGPLILVIDDLQWGDLPTVTFIDAAIRNLGDLPFLVLALARPEVTEIFPRLWVDRATQVVRLPPLPRRAAESLVKLSLGDTAPPELVNALVEKSGGNAFYLEELTRAVVSGEGAELPETVLAMAQARLDGLGSALRRILRAASVFGRAFTPEGVEALLGGDEAGIEVVACITELCAAEILVRREDGTLPGGAAYGFAQALMREAAYALLTADDRALGHRLAGGFLRGRGFSDATALAEHFERGGEPARAVSFYRRAAEEALSGNDLVTALERAARCAACGAAGEDLGALRLIEAEAYLWRGDFTRGEASAAEAAALLEPGSAAWFRAVEHAVVAAERLGDADRISSLAEAAAARDPAPGARNSQVRCLGWCAMVLTLLGRYELADAMLARTGERAGAEASDALDPHAHGALHQARAARALHGGDLGASLGHFEAAVAAFEEAGDRRNGCVMRQNLAYVLVELGGYAEAERALRAALAQAERFDLAELRANVLSNLGYALAQAGHLDEARGVEERAIEAFSKMGSVRQEGISHVYLARVHFAAGDAEAALREVAAADRLLAAAPPFRALAAATRARVLLHLRRADEALAAAVEAHALLVAAGGAVEEGESLVRLVYAEALAAAGREADARDAREAAKERLLARAARITSPVWRERFLTQVPENAATLVAEGGGRPPTPPGRAGGGDPGAPDSGGEAPP